MSVDTDVAVGGQCGGIRSTDEERVRLVAGRVEDVVGCDGLATDQGDGSQLAQWTWLASPLTGFGASNKVDAVAQHEFDAPLNELPLQGRPELC